MTSVREFYEKETAKIADRRQRLVALRRFYHSVHANERDEVIDLLASFAEPDAARELMILYEQCQWRETRFAVVRALARNPDVRTFEFLFRLARSADDIPLAETAIRALGQTHHPMAAKFLSHLYRDGNKVLRPAVAGAIGDIPDPTMAQTLLKDLGEALKSDQTAFVKYVVLALGELKVSQAIPLLIPIAARRESPALSLCALVSLGKLLRDPSKLEPLETLFSRDPFEYHIFSGALMQARLRSQWTLEDYLQKFFESPSPHRSLPLELNAFPPKDVFEAFALFPEEKHAERKLQILAKLGFAETLDWYEKLFDPTKLSSDLLGKWLVSLSAHGGPVVEKALIKIRDRVLKLQETDASVFEKWMEAVALSAPSAAEIFTKLVSEGNYAKLAVPARISVVNHLVSFGLISPSNTKVLEKAGTLLKTIFDGEKDLAVRGRLLRAFAQLGIREEKVAVFVKDELLKGPLTPSCLVFLEKLPHRKAIPATEAIVQDKKLRNQFAYGLLRAIAAQTTAPDVKELDEFLTESLTGADQERKVAALNCLTNHPRPETYEAVLACLKAEEPIILAAIVALRGFRQEDSATALAPFLRSASPSLSGRALDTLAALPGISGKKIVIDFMKERIDDTDIVDKVTRSLEAPPTNHEYFINLLKDILKKQPDHPQREKLLDLAERMLPKKETTTTKIPDGGLIDASILKMLPCFTRLDEAVKSALRSAEMPFVHREPYEGSVDKAASILEYCKALDLYLERHLGKNLLYTSLEKNLFEFQNIVHGACLNEDYPSAQRVLVAMGLEKTFNSENFPLHKSRMVARGILDGRILQDRFRVLDGLRAWAVMLLLFARSSGSERKPILFLDGATDVQIIGIAKRMMNLQDIRNPAAHRQTFLEFVGVTEVRGQVFHLLTDLESLVH